MKCHPHPKKHGSILPHLGEEICAFVQAYAIQWCHRVCPLVDVRGQTLRRDGMMRQASDVFIEIAVVEFVLQSVQTRIDRIVTNQRPILSAEWFGGSVRQIGRDNYVRESKWPSQTSAHFPQALNRGDMVLRAAENSNQ